MNTIWKEVSPVDLGGTTVIVPSVAVGNVGQLACDLLISSLKMKKVASVYSPAFIPVMGYDPYDLRSNNISSCCELYKSETNIAVLQIRAPLIFKYAQEFLRDIMRKFQEKGMKELVILTSSHAHEKKLIQTSPFRYICHESSSYKTKMETLGLTAHTAESGMRIYGGGFALLLGAICKENSIPYTLLYKFCSEGDNIPDAYDMVAYLNNIVPVFDEKTDLLKQLIQPVSWKLLFGRPPPKDIY